MTEVNGQPVLDFQMTMDTTTGMYGAFTAPGPGAFRLGDGVTITGHGPPIVGIVRSVRWSPTMTEVEWVSGLVHAESLYGLSADSIIDRYARELAERHPA